MLSVSRIVRDYRDAGAANELLALWGFIAEGVILTKAGHPVALYALRGVDVEGLSQAQKRLFTHQMEAAIKALDERSRVYQYLVKRTMDPAPAPTCPQPVAQEAVARRSADLNARRDRLFACEHYVA